MTQVSQETMMFKRNNENKDVSQTISEVCKALEEKGYNPIDQLVGYLLSGDPTYITSHDDARTKLRRFERYELIEELVVKYLEKTQNKTGRAAYMRSMSLDVGTRTIGVAASDLMGMIANGVETIRRTSEERDLQRIGELIAEYEVDTMVVGYPKNMNGSVGERAQSCEDFARVIGERFPQLKIVLWDERLSTVAAEKILIDADLRRSKRKKVIDMMAAVVILQNYLDSPQSKRTE